MSSDNERIARVLESALRYQHQHNVDILSMFAPSVKQFISADISSPNNATAMLMATPVSSNAVAGASQFPSSQIYPLLKVGWDSSYCQNLLSVLVNPVGASGGLLATWLNALPSGSPENISTTTCQGMLYSAATWQPNSDCPIAGEVTLPATADCQTVGTAWYPKYGAPYGPLVCVDDARQRWFASNGITAVYGNYSPGNKPTFATSALTEDTNPPDPFPMQQLCYGRGPMAPDFGPSSAALGAQYIYFTASGQGIFQAALWSGSGQYDAFDHTRRNILDTYQSDWAAQEFQSLLYVKSSIQLSWYSSSAKDSLIAAFSMKNCPGIALAKLSVQSKSDTYQYPTATGGCYPIVLSNTMYCSVTGSTYRFTECSQFRVVTHSDGSRVLVVLGIAEHVVAGIGSMTTMNRRANEDMYVMTTGPGDNPLCGIWFLRVDSVDRSADWRSSCWQLDIPFGACGDISNFTPLLIPNSESLWAPSAPKQIINLRSITPCFSNKHADKAPYDDGWFPSSSNGGFMQIRAVSVLKPASAESWRTDHDSGMWVARGMDASGNLIPGWCQLKPGEQNACYLPFGGSCLSIPPGAFSVFTSQQYTWVSRTSTSTEPWPDNAVAGGTDIDGAVFYVARGQYESTVFPNDGWYGGKCRSEGKCWLAVVYPGESFSGEREVTKFDVLTVPSNRDIAWSSLSYAVSTSSTVCIANVDPTRQDGVHLEVISPLSSDHHWTSAPAGTSWCEQLFVPAANAADMSQNPYVMVVTCKDFLESTGVYSTVDLPVGVLVDHMVTAYAASQKSCSYQYNEMVFSASQFDTTSTSQQKLIQPLGGQILAPNVENLIDVQVSYMQDFLPSDPNAVQAQASDYNAVPAYLITFTLLSAVSDDQRGSNQAREGEPVLLWASADCTAWLNGVKTQLSPGSAVQGVVQPTGTIDVLIQPIPIPADDVSDGGMNGLVVPQIVLYAASMPVDEKLVVDPSVYLMNSLSLCTPQDVAGWSTYPESFNGAKGAAYLPSEYTSNVSNTQQICDALHGLGQPSPGGKQTTQQNPHSSTVSPDGEHISQSLTQPVTGCAWSGSKNFTVAVDQNGATYSETSSSSTSNAIPLMQLNASNGIIGGFEHFVKNVVNGIEQIVDSTITKLETGVKAAVNTISKGIQAAYEFTITEVSHAVQWAAGLLKSIKQAVCNIIEDIENIVKEVWEILSALFNWDAILTTHTSLKTLVKTFSVNVTDLMTATTKIAISDLDSVKTGVDAAFDAAINHYQGTGDSINSNTSSQAVTDAKKTSNSQNAQYFNRKLSSSLNVNNADIAAGDDSTLPTFADVGADVLQWLEGLGKAAENTMKEEMGDLKQTLLDLLSALNPNTKANILSTGLADFMKMAKTLFDGGINMSEAFLAGVPILGEVIEAALKTADSTLDIPFFSWLYKKLVRTDLTFLDLACLLMALPVQVFAEILSDMQHPGYYYVDMMVGFYKVSGPQTTPISQSNLIALSQTVGATTTTTTASPNDQTLQVLGQLGVLISEEIGMALKMFISAKKWAIYTLTQGSATSDWSDETREKEEKLAKPAIIALVCDIVLPILVTAVTPATWRKVSLAWQVVTNAPDFVVVPVSIFVGILAGGMLAYVMMAAKKSGKSLSDLWADYNDTEAFLFEISSVIDYALSMYFESGSFKREIVAHFPSNLQPEITMLVGGTEPDGYAVSSGTIAFVGMSVYNGFHSPTLVVAASDATSESGDLPIAIALAIEAVTLTIAPIVVFAGIEEEDSK